MKIQVTLRCACGADIEEISGVECEKFPQAISHRHGQCPACERAMICVCEGDPPHALEGVH